MPPHLRSFIFAALLLLATLPPKPGVATEMRLDLVEVKLEALRLEDQKVRLLLELVVPVDSHAEVQELFLAIRGRDNPDIGRIRIRFREMALANGRSHSLKITIPPGGSEDKGVYEILRESAAKGVWPHELVLSYSVEDGTLVKPSRKLQPLD